MKIIGVDFDNTIICYDDVFHKVAVTKGLIPKDFPVSKDKIRDILRGKGQEKIWTELQGLVYGKFMFKAKPFPGVWNFFRFSKKYGFSVCIISHRTRFPYVGPKYDLHQTARDWLEKNGFYVKSQLSPNQVFFEISINNKLNRIAKERCDIFIDDLPELFRKSEFPKNIRRVLFDPMNHYDNEIDIERLTSWNEIVNLITS